MGRWGGRDSASAGERDGAVTPEERTRWQDLRLRLAKTGLTNEEHNEYERLRDKFARVETGGEVSKEAHEPEKEKGEPAWRKESR